MNKRQKPFISKELRDALQWLQDSQDNVKWETIGICGNLSYMGYHNGLGFHYESPYDILPQMFKYMGLDSKYPVPETDAWSSGLEPINRWEGKYGDNRKYLLQILVDVANGWDVPDDWKPSWPHNID